MPPGSFTRVCYECVASGAVFAAPVDGAVPRWEEEEEEAAE